MTDDDRFAWTTNLALRSELRIGTILEREDFAYIWVDGIMQEGVIGPAYDSVAELDTWASPERSRCRIHSQSGWPGREKFGNPAPRVVRRGGWLDLERDGWLGAAEPAERAASTGALRGKELEMELARAVAAGARAEWHRIDCVIDLPSPGKPLVVRATCSLDCGDAAIALGPEARALAKQIEEETRSLRSLDCIRVVLWITRDGDGVDSYEVVFEYRPVAT